MHQYLFRATVRRGIHTLYGLLFFLTKNFQNLSLSRLLVGHTPGDRTHNKKRRISSLLEVGIEQKKQENTMMLLTESKHRETVPMYSWGG